MSPLKAFNVKTALILTSHLHIHKGEPIWVKCLKTKIH